MADRQISRQTIEVVHTRMNRWIAQKFNGELFDDKNKLACSCHQMLPISPDGCSSGPHAVRGLLCDPPPKRADNIRVIRVSRRAGPVPKKKQKVSPRVSVRVGLRESAVNCALIDYVP